jgi:uncharacterized protein (TIGR00255 family)
MAPDPSRATPAASGPLRSMTGFGAAAVERDGQVVRAEVRTVNHRYLQVKVRALGELGDFEGPLEAVVRRRLERGAVQVSLRMESASGEPPVEIDRALARRYAELARGLADELGLAGELDLGRLIALPGVLAPRGAASDAQALGAQAEAALTEALDALIVMREREGRALAEDMAGHLQHLGRLVEAIRARMPEVVRALFEAQRRRLAELLGDSRPVAEADLARELALLVDRTDVSEELARLASHLEQCGELLAAGGPVGRRLDFLVQELLREVNTIASKCQDARVAQWAVEAKTTVERLREQVQNAE